MFRALGIIEFSSIAKGVEAADTMVKSSSVEVLTLKHICPGKFLVILCGDVEDVKIAVETTICSGKDKIVETAVISNAHTDLLLAFRKRIKTLKTDALGIFEVSTVTSALISLDLVLKSTKVNLFKLVIGNGIGGKSYYIVTGDVGSVKEAIKIASNSIDPKKIIYKTVIPFPNQEIINNL